jgi:hypothetical protein
MNLLFIQSWLTQVQVAIYEEERLLYCVRGLLFIKVGSWSK